MNPEENNDNQASGVPPDATTTPEQPVSPETQTSPEQPASPEATAVSGASAEPAAPEVLATPKAQVTPQEAIVSDAATAAEAPTEDSPAGNLDQVAADLASAAENNALESTESSASPEAPADSQIANPQSTESQTADSQNTEPQAANDVAPDTAPFAGPAPEMAGTSDASGAPTSPSETAVSPDAQGTPELETPASPDQPVSPDTTVASDISSGSSASDAPLTPEASATQDASSTPETPAPSDTPFGADTSGEAPINPTEPPMGAPAENPVESSADAPAENQPEDNSYSTSANFVNDASAPTEDTESAPASSSSDEEEEPLKPAAPVPGSIGSALAYSETAPDHAIPIGKTPKIKVKKPRKPLTKENLKLLIAIIGGVTLVAIVAVIIFFIISNSNGGNKSSNTKPSDNTTPAKTVSSLTCTINGDSSVFSNYGPVVSGTEQVIAMYTNDALSSYGTTVTLTFGDEDAARSGQSLAREQYSKKVTNAGLTQDPFSSSYDVSGNTTTITHQAEGDDIDSKTAKILDFYVIKGEPATDLETLIDTFESDGYTCVEK